MSNLESGRMAVVSMLMADLPLIAVMAGLTECMKKYGNTADREVGEAIDAMIEARWGAKKQ